MVCLSRTNIDIDDDVIARVQATYGLAVDRDNEVLAGVSELRLTRLT